MEQLHGELGISRILFYCSFYGVVGLCRDIVDTVYRRIHSVMMVFLAQLGEGGGTRPPPLTLSTFSTRV
jgi:hypothetical protein